MPEEIFSRSRRRLNRARARRAKADSQWLLDHMADELADRLSAIRLDIQRVRVIGHGVAQVRAALPQASEIICQDCGIGAGVDLVADEDQPLAPPGSLDLVFACGTLDTLDDLPGALILIRRALRPGGLFLGAMLGAGSLAGFRALVREAEAALSSQSALRFHPQIDVRAAGDLLFRAGFSTPVADQDAINVRYSTAQTLRADSLGAGAGNALLSPQPLPRAVYHRVADQLGADGWADSYAPIYLTGWAPEVGETRPSGPVKGFL